MALSLAIIIIFGLIFNKAFNKINLPGLLGMLILGVIIGPYGLNIISPKLITISPDLRKIALIVILLRAGLGIKKETLKKVGIPAIKLSFIPGLLEGITVLFISSHFFKLPYIEAGMLAFIIAAVSPAVIVPQMLNLIKNKKGTNKGIPTLILTGASVDDVVAITIFSTFLGLYGGTQINLSSRILNIPISIITGILLGTITALFLIYFFKRFHMRDTKKTLLMLSAAIILTGFEDLLTDIIPIAALLGVMTMGFVLQEKYQILGTRLAAKFNKIWVFAEIMLFVLIGAEVNIYLAMDSGLTGLLIIVLGLSARGVGVLFSVIGTNLNWKERVFAVIAYTPKATVQAAIGAVPLTMGVKSGELILAIAVLSIVITAPLGAAGIKLAGKHWLKENNS